MAHIAVDLDGVLYDWDGCARWLLATRFPEHAKALSTPSTHWDSIKERCTPMMWRWLWDEGVVKHGLFRYGHNITGGIAALQELSKGHDISIVTSRPKSAVKDTSDWCSFMLDKVPLAGLHILHGGAKKTTIAWDVLVDDGLHNAQDAVSAGRHVALFAQPWNKVAFSYLSSQELAYPLSAPLFKRFVDWRSIVTEIAGGFYGNNK